MPVLFSCVRGLNLALQEVEMILIILRLRFRQFDCIFISLTETWYVDRP